MVTMKRLRDTNPCACDEFHCYMDLIDHLGHQHLQPTPAPDAHKRGTAAVMAMGLPEWVRSMPPWSPPRTPWQALRKRGALLW
jgi:hypothetical protein